MPTKLFLTVLIAISFSAPVNGAARLPGDYLVLTYEYIEPDDSGIWYMGGYGRGYLYVCTENRIYEFENPLILDDDPETASYYLIALRPGGSIRSGEVLAEPTPGYPIVRVKPSDLKSFIEQTRAYETKRLLPVKPTGVIFRAESPPEYNPEIADAVADISNNEILDYITTLQGFNTRYSYTANCEAAGKWLNETMNGFGLSITLDNFFGCNVDGVAVGGDGDKCWVSGTDGKIFYTNDGGLTWFTAETGTQEWFWSVSMIDDFNGYAAGSGGVILHTTDGETWQSQTTPLTDWVFGIDFVDYENGCAVCDNGRILFTANGGEDWGFASSPTSVRLYDVSFGTTETGWAVGRYGTVLKSEDGGITWSRQYPGVSTRLYGVKALDADEAWVVGWEGAVLHTIDGGDNWTAVGVDPTTFFYGVDFVNKDVGYICGSAGAVYKTVDGGASWELLETPLNALYTSVSFMDSEKGYVVGDNSIIKTNDGENFEDVAGNIDDRWTTVIGEKYGETNADEIVIVCAHYDSISDDPYNNAPGADDNASGTASVLATARVLADIPTERTIRFVCFSGEEEGLIGSHHYANYLAETGENVAAVVNLDMVAYDEEHGARDDTSLISNTASEWLADYYLSCDALYTSGLIFDSFTDDTITSSDHSSFWDTGYPAVLLIEGETNEGGTTEYPYYHTSEDTVDKLTVRLNTFNARAAAAAIAHLAHYYESGDGGPDEWVRPKVYPNPVRVASGETSVTFDRLRPQSTVSIYTVAGELVSETLVQDDTFVWNLTSRGGNRVASGVYVWRVKNDAHTATGKIAVIK
jgi:photosystem II stability/assembly factor-like uncharacterized protein